jgi:hypothetical protein
VSTLADRSVDPEQLTFRYIENDDGWVTAQIAEFPEAISQGRTQHEAWVNVLDALHDLTHEPTTAERLTAFLQVLFDGSIEEIEEARDRFRAGLLDASGGRGGLRGTLRDVGRLLRNRDRVS